MATELHQAPWIGERLPFGTPSHHVERWMKVWVGIGVLVVLVVVGFLLAITSALAAIDGNLAGVVDQVGGAGGDVEPLPAHVEKVNGSLTGIDTALKAIPGQADTIIGALTSIDGKLTNVDSLLKNTSGNLVTVLGRARTIDQVLERADHPADGTAFGAGTGGIWRRVQFANSMLDAKGNANNVLVNVKLINGHLKSICRTANGGC